MRISEFLEVVGEDLSSAGMAALYRASDAYVTASMAEAFQLPLAEATAAGLPVIAPAGGAAEEVVEPSTALLVASTTRERTVSQARGVKLPPSPTSHLSTPLARSLLPGAHLFPPLTLPSHQCARG